MWFEIVIENTKLKKYYISEYYLKIFNFTNDFLKILFQITDDNLKKGETLDEYCSHRGNYVLYDNNFYYD